MFEIDGSLKSGSGTILRLAVAFSAITKKQLRIYNIRHNRPQPGLKPQHLEAVLTAAKLCNAEIKGAKLNSRELSFNPGTIRGGNIEAQIGTAGSIPMLLLTILPICAASEEPVKIHVTNGGTDTANAPTINYLDNVLLTMLSKMGISASISVHKYGYYPKGMGEVTLTVKPTGPKNPIRLQNFRGLRIVRGVSTCTFLADKRVAERQANAAREYLSARGLISDIRVVNDFSNPMQKGSSIALWTENEGEAILGSDSKGEMGKPSERVGIEAAERLFSEIQAKSTVDVHLADMLIPYIALTEGSSVFFTRMISEHLETNMWLASKMLGTRFNTGKENRLFRVEKSD
ncbi:TPA: RNA 3'-terminal phosphate cyclase [Candidatus Bathyarchaeota archaeon]|nr:RNA 3'-terminal phosphate cyclase [Candidatus Bathyarchaeota archaeon]